MEDKKIKNIKNQLNAGSIIKTYEYHCCGSVFTGRIKFQEHLFHKHLEEYIIHFADFFQKIKNKTVSKDKISCCNYTLTTKNNIIKKQKKESKEEKDK